MTVDGVITAVAVGAFVLALALVAVDRRRVPRRLHRAEAASLRIGDRSEARFAPTSSTWPMRAPGQSPRSRPTISFMISVVPP